MPCIPASWSASFTSSSLNGLMMASIFFTQRLPGISLVQTAGWVRRARGVVRSPGHAWGARVGSIVGPGGAAARWHQLPVSTTILSRLPQKQGLCQVVNAPEFRNVISLLSGIRWGLDRMAHNTQAYGIGKQFNRYAIAGNWASRTMAAA